LLCRVSVRHKEREAFSNYCNPFKITSVPVVQAVTLTRPQGTRPRAKDKHNKDKALGGKDKGKAVACKAMTTALGYKTKHEPLYTCFLLQKIYRHSDNH